MTGGSAGTLSVVVLQDNQPILDCCASPSGVSYGHEAGSNHQTGEGRAMTQIGVIAREMHEGAEIDRISRVLRTLATYAGIAGIMLGSSLVILTLG